jgi:hypothetical protein
MSDEKAWMVTRGRYSDYGMIAVFTDEASAKAYAEMLVANGGVSDYDGAEVEEVPLNPSIPVLPAGCNPYCVRMERNGDSLARVDDYGFWANADWGDRRCHWMKRGRGGAVIGKIAVWQFSVTARDEEHAVKIANERRVQLIANGKWESD